MTDRHVADTLMVIVPDRLSDIVAKGEVTARYYNPGDLFREVHLVLTNDDNVDSGALQKMVGSARLHVHNLPTKNLFFKSLGWRPWLLAGWAGRAVDLARWVLPSLIRCHGANLNAFAASEIKRILGIPYVVSLHINPDEDQRGRAATWKDRLAAYSIEAVERRALLNADMVLPVYLPIVKYLKRLGVKNYRVAYNALNEDMAEKTDYSLHNPVRVISVGRQFAEKNPDNLIRAVRDLPNVELTLVGDGSFHDHLRNVASECGLSDRCRFFRALPNDELCASLPGYDIFATHSEYWEISKSLLEPLLTGLPVVINRRIGEPVPELTSDICMLAENTTESYHAALRTLIEDHAQRERLGRRAFRRARELWAPGKTEAVFVEIYRSLMRR